MTKFILHKNKGLHPFTRIAYKATIFAYSFYLIFSSQAFALQADAPKGGKSFTELIIIDKKEVKEEKEIDTRAMRIEKYYNRHNLPLAKHAQDFVDSADKYGIDWRLVAAIGMIESTGGKFACRTARYSAFGWGSCKINFNSYEESIDVISKNLAGQNPNTAYHYAGKDIKGILQAYNPPSIVPDYAQKVMRQMEIIEQQ